MTENKLDCDQNHVACHDRGGWQITAIHPLRVPTCDCFETTFDLYKIVLCGSHQETKEATNFALCMIDT